MGTSRSPAAVMRQALPRSAPSARTTPRVARRATSLGSSRERTARLTARGASPARGGWVRALREEGGLDRLTTRPVDCSLMGRSAAQAYPGRGVESLLRTTVDRRCSDLHQVNQSATG